MNKIKVVGVGLLCIVCNEYMERRRHNTLIFKKAKGYFTCWDYCKFCKRVQHYEMFRVKA